MALGALIARTGWVTPEAGRVALTAIVGKKRPAALVTDLAAYELGLGAGRQEPVPA